MGTLYEAAKRVYRKWVTDGVPASGSHEPAKSEIWSLFRDADAPIEASGLNMLLQRDNKHARRRIRFNLTGTASGNSVQSFAIDERDRHYYTLQSSTSGDPDGRYRGVIRRFAIPDADAFSTYSGEFDLDQIDEQPLHRDVGHQGLSVEYMTSGIKLWCPGEYQQTGQENLVHRFDYNPSGAPQNMQSWKVFPDGWRTATPALSYAAPGEKSKYLVVSAHDGVSIGKTRVWLLTDVLAAADGSDISANYIAEMDYPLTTGVFWPLQSVAATETHIWIGFTSANLYEPKIIVCYTIDGRYVWQSKVNVGQYQAGQEDPGTEVWEGEGMAFFRADPTNPELSIAYGIVTGSTKINGLWFLGAGEAILRRTGDDIYWNIHYGGQLFHGSVPITVGTATPANQKLGQGQNRSSELWANFSTSGDSEANHYFLASRSGVVGVHGALSDDDNVQQARYYGDDGVNFVQGGFEIVKVYGPVIEGRVPMRKVIRFTDTDGTSGGVAYEGKGLIPSAGYNLGKAGTTYGKAYLDTLIRKVRQVTAAGDVSVSVNDGVVAINKTTGSTTAVTLPDADIGATFTVVDAKGDAAANNITVSPPSGTINGSASVVISSAYGSRTFTRISSDLWSSN